MVPTGNVNNPYVLVDDRENPLSFDFLVTVEDSGKFTNDGVVSGGNKIKIGLPITLEADTYRLDGKITNVKILSVENNENEYKKNVEYLKKLEKENEYLTKINKELKEQINDSNYGLEANGKQKSRELNNLKKEMKLIKDSSNILKQNIKLQNTKIINLEQEINKIKGNIDFAKAQQEKENNMNKAKENNNNKSDSNIDIYKDLSEEEIIEKIKEYIESIKKLEVETKEQENNYNTSIKKQNKLKSKIDSDLKILKIKIKQMKKGNKIRELKLKEIKKIQEMEQKKKMQLEQEKKKKEEKRKKEVFKMKKYLEFQKKIKELGLNGDDEDNPADERNNYYNYTSMDNYNNKEFISQNKIMPNTAKNKNYGNFSSYSNRNAPFSIKFKNNNNRMYTQAQNDYENEIENDNYDEFNNNTTNNNDIDIENESNKKNNKNGKVINDIDDLKNDILNTLNKDDNNIDEKIENIKKNKDITNDDNNDNNEDINEYIDDENNNNDINDNGNINGNNNIDMKVSGNRSPFNIPSFNSS